MVGVLGGPELPDDDALRDMVMTGPTDFPGAEAVPLDQLGPFDASATVDALQGVIEPGSPYRQQRADQQLRLGRGSGQLVLDRLRLAPEQFAAFTN